MYHPRLNDQGQPVKLKAPSQPTPPESWADVSALAIAVPDGVLPESLNGIPLNAIDPGVDWQAPADGMAFDEPAFNPPAGLKPSAGVVILEADGRVWLCAPSNGFGGYAQTCPKGRLDGKSLKATALQEAFEETGLQVRLTGHLVDLPRSTTYTRYYLAERTGGTPAAMGWESQAVLLAPREQLPALLVNKHDQPLLAAIERHLQAIATAPRAATRHDWPIQPMPAQHLTLALDFCLDAEASAAIKRGYIPQQQEDKWFAYFDGNTLHHHRSWTGYCIYSIHFEPYGDGLRATHAEVNSDSAQYAVEPEAEPRKLEELTHLLVSTHLSPLDAQSDPFGIRLASQPNYLGSIGVVQALFRDYLKCVLDRAQHIVSQAEVMDHQHFITRVMTEDGTGYTRMPGWHTTEALGAHLVNSLNLDPEYCRGESLVFIVSEGLAAIQLAASTLSAQNFSTLEEAKQRVEALLHFIVSAFMGTDVCFYPGKTLRDMVAPPVATPPPQDNGFDQLLKEIAALAERLPPFRFDALGIQPGSVLSFKLDPSTRCKVAPGNKVLLDGEIMSLSKAAVKMLNLHGRPVSAARGPDYWLYQGMALTQYRQQCNGG